MPTATELNINTSASSTQMAQEIFGDGTTVVSASYSGDAASSGIYTGADTTVAGVAPADSGVILSTGHVADFTNSSGSSNTNTSGSTSTNTSGTNGDADFNALAGSATYDASYMEIDFIPDGDVLTLDFVLSSEEYPEFSNSQYNDVVGVWVNGVQAQVTIGDGSASIGNINQNDTQNIYVDNTNDQYNTEMDGFTITLTFTAPVNAGVVNSIKIGVADVSDSSYDTNLLVAGGSVQTAFVAQDDILDTSLNASRSLDVLANDSSTAGGTLTITHINDIAVSVGDTVTLATGQQITLNPDGTLQVLADGDNETVYFNYTTENDSGDSDTALVEINQAQACFLRGTLIDTPNGAVAIEDLRAGMMVQTYDSGPQPLRWVGHSRVPLSAATAPIRFSKGQLGAESDLLVSPNHRMLITGQYAELLFGEDEVLVKAKDLVNDCSIRPDHSLEWIDYYHLLFDQHEILTSQGVLSESYHPGPQTSASFDAETQAELFALFPELSADQSKGYGAAARPALRHYEAKLLNHCMN
ncbi:choice-of-anchor L domain-containing protein [Pseudophaeobacter sp.]|uniref:choice-of-anchor L domain-containing protein n=1 Tax=Pseudophaeobacter sp. TaxID=1971739 RepID=UPI00329A7E86